MHLLNSLTQLIKIILIIKKIVKKIVKIQFLELKIIFCNVLQCIIQRIMQHIILFNILPFI